MRGGRLLDALVGDAAIAALFDDAADLAAMQRAEVALAEAQAAVGAIPPAAAAAIRAALADFAPDWTDLARGLAQDGVVIPALVRQWRAAVGPPHGGALHTGATSQDIIDTSLVLRLKQAIDILEDRLDGLVEGLSALRQRDGAKTLMAHTRMQAALPFTAGDKIDTWSAPLSRTKQRLAAVKSRVLVLQLGGPIGTRRELGADARLVAAGMAERLGLGDVPAWHAQRDAVAEFGSWLSLLSGSLGKIGQDVALLAQSEVAAVTLAERGSSSAMAHKANPVGAEVLVALARFNAGQLGTLHGTLVHENERSGAAWTLEWMALPPMVITAGAGLRTAASLVRGLVFT